MTLRFWSVRPELFLIGCWVLSRMIDAHRLGVIQYTRSDNAHSCPINFTHVMKVTAQIIIINDTIWPTRRRFKVYVDLCKKRVTRSIATNMLHSLECIQIDESHHLSARRPNQCMLCLTQPSPAFCDREIWLHVICEKVQPLCKGKVRYLVTVLT